MIRPTSARQHAFPNFDLPFGGHLDPKNRWVRWGDLLPWEGLESAYHAVMDPKQGRPSKPARMVLGSLVIKHKLGLSDEETVRQIQENPYLQYFLGMHGFSSEPPFSPTLFVEFRKRLGKEAFDAMDQVIIDAMGALEQRKAQRKRNLASGDAKTASGAGTHGCSPEDGAAEEMAKEMVDTALPEDLQIEPLPLAEVEQAQHPEPSPTADDHVDDAPSIVAEAAPEASSTDLKQEATTPDESARSFTADTDSNDEERVATQPDAEVPSHKGKLIMDATVADQAIRFPTDLSLLNEARVSTEQIIDAVHAQLPAGSRKVRTYRCRARQDFLAVTKGRQRGGNKVRIAIRKQLNYIRRNLASIDRMLDTLISDEAPAFPVAWKFQHRLFVVRTLYAQQREMYESRTRRCDDRIVSISQPHVRPIVRGKAGRPVEFGSKSSASLVNGLAFVDKLRWDAFNEAGDLIGQVERYRERFGYYPEVVLADGIYGTRANRSWLKEHGIRYGGKPLGRPRKETEANREELKAEKRQRKQDALDRIPVEGKFGQAKGGYGLNYIRAKRANTSEAWVRTIFLVMNLMVLITAFLRPFLRVRPLLRVQIMRKMGRIAWFRRMLPSWAGHFSQSAGSRHFISGACCAC